MKGSRALTDKEIDDVLNVLKSPRDRALFMLGVKTGLRVSELLSLRITDVWKNGVTDFVTVQKRNTKGKIESKTLPLTASVKTYLAAHIGTPDKDQPLFKSTQGDNAITRMMAHRILKNAFNQLGLQGNCSTHSMRKTYAHRIHKALGEKIEMTQVALCHKSLSSTASYLQIDREAVENAIRGLG